MEDLIVPLSQDEVRSLVQECWSTIADQIPCHQILVGRGQPLGRSDSTWSGLTLKPTQSYM